MIIVKYSQSIHAHSRIQIRRCEHTYLDLDLCLPVPVGKLGDEVPLSGTVVGNHHGFFAIVGNAHHAKVLS